MLKLQTCVKARSIIEALLKCGKESSAQVEAGHEEGQDKARRLAEALGSARSAKAQNPLMLPAFHARSQSSYSLAYTGDWGRGAGGGGWEAVPHHCFSIPWGQLSSFLGSWPT